MDHAHTVHLIGVIALVLGTARLFGMAAKRIGQPEVLGEMAAGIVLGMSVLQIVDPHDELLLFLAEIGIIILLLEIGLETDLDKLFQVGGAAAMVAMVGVALPFALGYAACRLLGLDNLVAIVAGATLTATSVGITARVLGDLGRLHDPESRVILGAAVIDDVIGLVILAVVSRMAAGQEVSWAGVAMLTAVAFGFLIFTVLIGRAVVPPVVAWLQRFDVPGMPVVLAIVVTFALAWGAAQARSAPIIGAFAAGLLLRRTVYATQIEHATSVLARFFVPVFFVTIGAAVDLSVLNPLNPANHAILAIGGLLLVGAIAGKFLAGYAPFWFSGRKTVIGVGMIPRGEVGLIFAETGLRSKILDPGMFSAVSMMVMITTFITPPLLGFLLRPSGIALPETPSQPE